ncbi:metal ABC transporter substrate-binding protein [Agromyces sp. MMS24-K17]|uniref:metal ABC transporter substrate-binding protein n=1 Tax=Agromyces sp. MMS24-K17 TaxID=3372850 RepID=UPI0037552607
MRARTTPNDRRPRTATTARGAAVALGVAAVTALALTGCAGGAASGEASGPRIVATTTQVADFTRELVGDEADVTQLLQAGQSAHSFDPSAAQLAAIAGADALVVNGAGLESWLDDAIDAAGYDGPVIDASTGIELEHTGDDHDHDHGDEADHDDEASDAHDDHDHAEGNPHIWTDPALAAVMVQNIADGLADVPGLDADAVDDAETAYVDRLTDLDAWIRENVDLVPVEQRLLVTNHDAFTYFLHAYDVTLVGSVIPSFDDNAEPSAAEMDQLVADIRATGVQAVFAEDAISPKTAETIAREAGVTVYSGEDALYGDSLGQPGTEGETYLGSQLHNVRLMLESWGVEASEPPASLRG